ncbi:MAG: NAD(P)-dependent oxidoreductase [Deltaproteobacteria bacterium]|nr:NAD(P)-dependent oxidoreductase [Deltaproteobacteria bacterium]
MRVVVTGGAGRLGQFVVRELFTHAHQVSTLDAVKPRECVGATYVVDLKKFDALLEHFKNADAVVHLARSRFPYTETGFDYASQCWRFSDPAGDAERFNLNIAITNNALAAAELAGVKKIVCGSSLAIYGLYYPTAKFLPVYLPVDEDHPLRPQDPYGLTKLAGENLATALSARTGMAIASLRFSGIYTEEHRGMLAKRKSDPLIRGTGALWSYIDARDAARAVRLALETKLSGHQAFNIAAASNLVGMPIQDLAERYLGTITDCRAGLNGNSSGYSVAKAKSVLGFEGKLSLVE